MLAPGERFPEFALKDQDGNTVTLEDLNGAPAVIYFYPKDDTPGCTVEACEFRDGAPSGAKVVGVSPDSVRSHRKFADKASLPFTLLSDPDRELCDKVGVWVEKSMYGRTYMGVARTTFVLDAAGIVTHVFEKVTPKGHAGQVAKALAATQG